MNDAQETPQQLFDKAGIELEGCRRAWRSGNAGKARVGARRAADMAIRAWLMTESDRSAYGTNFMHHLGGLADDVETSTAVREAAWRLAARGVPEGGFLHPLPSPLEPAADAAAIIVECRNRYACVVPPAEADE